MPFITEDEMLRIDVLSAVDKERTRQIELYGNQKLSMGDLLKVLVEEVGEIAQAMQKESPWGKDSDAGDLYEEFIHAAAVCVKGAELVRKERDKLEGN
jgi:NTP pyrophosphatase (non-canonical NTP hydrolase)